MALDNPKWVGLLIEMVKRIHTGGASSEQLTKGLSIPTRPDAYTKEGYRFYPELGISIQGQSAQDAWREIGRLAEKHRLPVEVEFQWRDNDKAQHPGRVGLIRAGS